jgi:hypothetical protein
MTDNRRAKRDARDRKAETGEPYTAARRRTSKSAFVPRPFEADSCANCFELLVIEIEGLFCSEPCQQTAAFVRTWRRNILDGRSSDPNWHQSLSDLLNVLPFDVGVEYVAKLNLDRVNPPEPTRLCDDPEQWDDTWPRLLSERRERLLTEHGYDPSSFRGESWQEVLDAIFDDDDYGERGIDDDSGFGPDSYFAHAMAKDD